MADTAFGHLNIDLGAVAANYQKFCDMTAPECAVAGIVKANAYGLGMTQVVPVLEREGCRRFFVATLDEAIAVRAITKQPVCVLGGLIPGAEAEYHAHGVTPVLNTLGDIDRWAAFAKKTEARTKAIIHFDTGMNRLGLGQDETRILLDKPAMLEGLAIIAIMSHFACADEKNHPLTEAQYQKFSAAAAHFPQAQKSLANSSGIFRDRKYHYDLVRPGMAIYGLNPTPETDNPMRATVSLHARILQVRIVENQDTVGYGATYRFDKKTTVATIGLGYTDGFMRAAGRNAVFYYKGHPCPAIGRVSMDLITVDMGPHTPQQGEMLEILGPNQSADTLAEARGTIGYEVLTNLGDRYHRDYKNG